MNFLPRNKRVLAKEMIEPELKRGDLILPTSANSTTKMYEVLETDTHGSGDYTPGDIIMALSIVGLDITIENSEGKSETLWLIKEDDILGVFQKEQK